MAKRSRRSFLTDVAIAGAGLTVVPRHVLGRGFTAPSDTLNIAAVGVGGQGRSNLVNLASENVVALTARPTSDVPSRAATVGDDPFSSMWR